MESLQFMFCTPPHPPPPQKKGKKETTQNQMLAIEIFKSSEKPSSWKHVWKLFVIDFIMIYFIVYCGLLNKWIFYLFFLIDKLF